MKHHRTAVRLSRPQAELLTLPRHGKVLILFAILLPALLSVSGLVIDVGVLLREYGRLEQIADAAASAAARDLLDGTSVSQAITTANNAVTANSAGTSTSVTVNIPPASGPHTGDGNYVEVLLSRTVHTHLVDFGNSQSTVTVRAVAGHEDVTGPAAVIVLSDQPVSFQGDYGTGEGGLCVLGTGTVDINGAVFVNDESGQFDENWNPAGNGPGVPFGISAQIPINLPRARVVGGVDTPSNFNGTIAGTPPLRANRRAVPDPLTSMPVPTINQDSNNVIPAQRGSFERVNSATNEAISPGVYDWIRIINSNVTLNPGVFIIRDINPLTNTGLELQGSQINGNGVLFYITDNTGFSANDGLPDANDTVETAPTTAWTSAPSVDIRLSGDTRLTALNDTTSPYHGVLIFQRRWDRRFIRLQYTNGYVNRLSGTVYAPVAKTSLYSAHDVRLQFAVGSLRLYNYSGLDVNPPDPFPPAREVFIVE